MLCRNVLLYNVTVSSRQQGLSRIVFLDVYCYNFLGDSGRITNTLNMNVSRGSVEFRIFVLSIVIVTFFNSSSIGSVVMYSGIACGY